MDLDDGSKKIFSVGLLDDSDLIALTFYLYYADRHCLVRQRRSEAEGSGFRILSFNGPLFERYAADNKMDLVIDHAAPVNLAHGSFRLGRSGGRKNQDKERDYENWAFHSYLDVLGYESIIPQDGKGSQTADVLSVS